MVQSPVVLRNLISGSSLRNLQDYVASLKGTPATSQDNQLFYREYLHNDPFFQEMHHSLITLVAIKIFKESLRPSYSFLSMYRPGLGICPLHTDRAQCYLTLALCLNQNRPWPLYINSTETEFFRDEIDYYNISQEKSDAIKRGSTEYILEVGDAICYSGTHHPHWRDRIPSDNFCDLIFFHFVKADFQGELE